MSDLQCAVTVLLVRHGEAVPDGPRRVSDDDRPLTARGLEQALQLGRSLADRRVAAVCSSTAVRARDTAVVVAGVLDLPVEVVEGAHEMRVGDLADAVDGPARADRVYLSWFEGDLSMGCPGGETGYEVVERVSSVLQDLADLHRGETVVLVTHGGVMSLVAAVLCRAPLALVGPGTRVPTCGVGELAGDGDGWSLVSWPGVPSEG